VSDVKRLIVQGNQAAIMAVLEATMYTLSTSASLLSSAEQTTRILEEALALLLDFLLRGHGEASMQDPDNNHSNEEAGLSGEDPSEGGSSNASRSARRKRRPPPDLSS
jgi:hypothetical protein